MIDRKQDNATNKAYGRPPADGERSALIGLVPQYEIAAGLTLHALTEETLEWIALLDPKAGRLDDFQIASPGRLDAYQIKWSAVGGQMTWSEIKANLADVLRDREVIADNNTDRRVYGHLYTNRVASSTIMKSQPRSAASASPAKAVAELLCPATEGKFASVDEIPASWRDFWTQLAADLGIEASELLRRLELIRFEFGRRRPTEVEIPDINRERYRRDVDVLRSTLLDVAIDKAKPVQIMRDGLLDRLPSEWRMRVELRSVHEFAPPSHYEPVQATVEELARAIDENTAGYIALIGSPGSGKSTLLSQELRGHGDVVARYYAYVRGRSDLGSVRGDAAAFLHDLILLLERRGLPRGPAPVDFDVSALTCRLEGKLAELGARYTEKGERSIVMVDGLDHVEREVEHDKSLLRYLPRPEVLPPGILFVLGSQSVKMLHPDIKVQLAEGHRTVTMRGLDREATKRIINARGVGVDDNAVYKKTQGHPLLTDYVLRELAAVEPAERDEYLAALPPYGGDVTVLYERLWNDLANDAALVELLALAARMRIAVDLGWLRDRGQPADVVRRFREKLAPLFRRQGQRWHFFHDSFRVFLRRRTTMLDPGDHPEPAEDRRYHSELVTMCKATAEPHPMAWETLFHLAAADDHSEVLNIATPGYFRSQTLALRPPELIAADIRMAARSLAVEQDSMAFVRLAISAGELSQRGYHLPERDQLIDILWGTGGWQTVVDLMDSERDGHGTEDSRTLRLEISVRLYRMGHVEEGRRLFDANEPLELLTGNKLNDQARGPYKLLYAWAKAAVLFRNAAAVATTVARVHVPPESVLGAGQGSNDQTEAVRAWMLAHAAWSADIRGFGEAADSLFALLDPDNDDQREAWVWILLQRADSHCVITYLDVLLKRVEPLQVDPEMRILVADYLARHDLLDDARRWIEGLGQPSLSDATSLSDLWVAEGDRYRLARVRSLLGERPDPNDVIPAPDADHRWGYVHIARIVVAIAQLDGMAWAGETLTQAEFLARAELVFRRLAIQGPDWLVASALRRIRGEAVSQLLAVAHEHGPPVAIALWGEIKNRWDKSRALLVSEGDRVLPVALKGAAVAGQEIRRCFGEFVQGIEATTEAQEMARAIGSAALTAIKLREPDQARQLLELSVASSLAVYERKDYQLGGWIELLGPLLDRDDGTTMAQWLSGTLAKVARDTGVVQANDAAESLLLGESQRRPAHAWRIGQWLEDESVVDRDDRQSWLLAANIDASATGLWWTVLADATVPIATKALGPDLVRAAQHAAAVHGRSWVIERLRNVTDHALIEGPPKVRAEWIESIADAAVACGLGLDQVGLTANHHPDRRPPRTRMRGTGEQERDEFLAAHSTLDELAADASSSQTGKSSEWTEALERLAPKLDRPTIERVLEKAEENADNLLTLAERCLEIGANDLARELAKRVLDMSGPSAWRRHWDGGSLLRALTVLWRLDPGPTRDLTYRRFAADASTDQFLLSEISRDLAHYLDLFGVDDRLALAHEVDAYMDVLLADPDPIPQDDKQNATVSLDGVLAASLIDLLVSSHRLAVTTAQRALVTALHDRSESVSTAIAEALADGDEETTLRILSVLETAAAGGGHLGDSILDALQPWATANDLAIRVAAREILIGTGRTPPLPPERPLPMSYKLVVPSPKTPTGMEQHRPLGDDLAMGANAWGGELDHLAKYADIDPELLKARVELLARHFADHGAKRGHKAHRESALGWSMYPPAMVFWHRAALHAAAELVDAGLVDAEIALTLTWGRLYDPALIGRRPSAQPSAIRPARTGDTRWVSLESWLQDLDGAEEDLARMVDGWTVVAEYTDIRRLDRDMPREQRWQRIASSNDDEGTEPPCLRPRRVADLPTIQAGVGQTPILRHEAFTSRGPSGWLALHPRLALACGLRPNDDDPLSYRDDKGDVRIWSVWWRNGWLHSGQWTTNEEVGEGWLVLADSAALGWLEKSLGDEPRMLWKVERDFCSSGKTEERVIEGWRSLSQ